MNVFPVFLFVCGVLLGVNGTVKPSSEHSHFQKPIQKKYIPSVRVSGGEEAAPHSIPYQAAVLTKYYDEETFCGGVLIAPDVVLTAGDCINFYPEYVRVILGAQKVLQHNETSQVIYTTKNYTRYEDPKRILKPNLGLIYLPENVTLNEYIQVVNLPENNDNTYENETGVVSGWGLPDQYIILFNATLYAVNVTVISNEYCKEWYGDTIGDRHICTSGEGGKGTCAGDAGAPLVVDGVLVGIGGVYYGCDDEEATAYTRISSFLDWIKENTFHN